MINGKIARLSTREAQCLPRWSSVFLVGPTSLPAGFVSAQVIVSACIFVLCSKPVVQRLSKQLEPRRSELLLAGRGGSNAKSSLVCHYCTLSAPEPIDVGGWRGADRK